MDKKALVEALKEVGRWLIFLVLSWFITETLSQINLVPETSELKLLYFTYTIPVRFLFQTGLTLLGRGLDKYLYKTPSWEFWSNLFGKKAAVDSVEKKSDGLLPF